MPYLHRSLRTCGNWRMTQKTHTQSYCSCLIMIQVWTTSLHSHVVFILQNSGLLFYKMQHYALSPPCIGYSGVSKQYTIQDTALVNLIVWKTNLQSYKGQILSCSMASMLSLPTTNLLLIILLLQLRKLYWEEAAPAQERLDRLPHILLYWKCLHCWLLVSGNALLFVIQPSIQVYWEHLSKILRLLD